MRSGLRLTPGSLIIAVPGSAVGRFVAIVARTVTIEKWGGKGSVEARSKKQEGRGRSGEAIGWPMVGSADDAR